MPDMSPAHEERPERQTTISQNPTGKLRPQIHMIVGGNPGGQHAISTLTDAQHTQRTSFTADTLNVLVHGTHTHTSTHMCN